MPAPATGAERTWTSLHVRCDGDTDELLRTVIVDVVDDLQERDPGTAWFYLRYWEGGPHVRLRLALRPTDREHAVALVRDRAGAWLAEHDPRYPAPEQVYDQIARRLAAREGEDREVLGWQPHGHVWEQPYVPEVDKYGDGASLRAYEQHFEESSALAARVLLGRPAPTQVLTVATLLVLTGWVREDVGPSARPRDELVDRWASATPLDRRKPPRAAAEMLRGLLSRARSGADPWCEEWRTSLERLHVRLLAADVPPADRSRGSDVCHHLLCNRLGLTLEQEVTVRRIAWDLLTDEAPANVWAAR
ncbi:lantibiotic dehydratase C-terminal domain-containing protein [Cellulomonas oligotrophica]|uniref:Thiopeptide-type bacteriocin biosynthesis protein n=1 Tax=Cellulomonas oligotrophica TaxID=931536 RepID=A0A7Y9JYC7_9CELL|nr:lantibiotic dehydratase C-terminal domain-containing protein [Cellulomonas oligotrophica]NYD86597.1 thiopeptide-type bacteriocin biosynthesis protein [Cellulomonas oligotrophica]GIG32513.1 hypothetical protein Col01nite_16720 [Cellulomonas oligotrophica]